MFLLILSLVLMSVAIILFIIEISDASGDGLEFLETAKGCIIFLLTPMIVGLGLFIFLMVARETADVIKITDFEIYAEYSSYGNDIRFNITLADGTVLEQEKNNESLTENSYVEKKTVLGEDFYNLYLNNHTYADLCDTIILKSDSIQIEK